MNFSIFATEEILCILHGQIFVMNAKTNWQISGALTAQLINIPVFATQIVQSLFYLYPKFQASTFLMGLYRPVCNGPGQDFSHAARIGTVR